MGDEGGCISGTPRARARKFRPGFKIRSEWKGREGKGRKLSGSQVAPSNFSAPTKTDLASLEGKGRE